VFERDLRTFYAILLACRARFFWEREIALKTRKNRGKIRDGFWMDFPQNRRQKMDFSPKLWIFPGAFVRKCAIMIESFEAGKSTVLAGFPIFLTPGGAAIESGICFLRSRRLLVRVQPRIIGIIP